MAIPESQLDTWSKQGSVAQSRDTYATVKKTLDDSSSPYYLKSFEPFLQGSYANDTNVYRDSDVDVVMRLDSAWYHDAPLLPKDQYQAFERAYPGAADYGLPEFKAQVAAWLKQKFNAVMVGSKAIFIPGSGARRDCDVLVCARFKYYYRFNSASDESYAEGICFFLKDGTVNRELPEAAFGQLHGEAQSDKPVVQADRPHLQEHAKLSRRFQYAARRHGAFLFHRRDALERSRRQVR